MYATEIMSIIFSQNKHLRFQGHICLFFKVKNKNKDILHIVIVIVRLSHSMLSYSNTASEFPLKTSLDIVLCRGYNSFCRFKRVSPRPSYVWLCIAQLNDLKSWQKSF